MAEAEKQKRRQFVFSTAKDKPPNIIVEDESGSDEVTLRVRVHDENGDCGWVSLALNHKQAREVGIALIALYAHPVSVEEVTVDEHGNEVIEGESEDPPPENPGVFSPQQGGNRGH